MASSSSLYVRVGAMILAGLAIGIGFLLFLTGGGFGRQSIIFETYLSESVTGLEIGAPVRYRGVQIGQVSEVGLVNAAYKPSSRNAAIEAFQLVLVRLSLDPAKATVDNQEDAMRSVERGLRSRLSSQGITGVAYIELDFVNPERFPQRELPWKPEYPVIPSMPSTVAQVQNAAEAILSRIQQAPLEQLLDDVSGIVSTVRTQMDDGDVARLLSEAAQTMALLRQVVQASDVPAMVAELRGVAADLRTTFAGPEIREALANTGAATEEMRRALTRLPAVITALEQTARAARNTTQDTNADLGPLLRDLRTVVSNLRDTTETLRRAPGQAIFGASPPPPSNR